MWHDVRLEREFFARLLAIDRAAAARTQAAGCLHCSGPVSVGHFERKPRGGLLAAAGEDAAFRQRFSFCCSREGCRRRATPPSVRFLGRKVYVEGAILVACVLLPLLQDQAQAIRAATGIAARTVRRWSAWWQSVFAASALYVEARARIPGLVPTSLPGTLLELFEGSTMEGKLELLMRFLAPLTSTPLMRSSSPRDIS